MNLRRVSLVLGALLATGTVFAVSQDTQTAPATTPQATQAQDQGGMKPHRMRHGRRGGGQLGFMARTLNLSDDQVSQIKPILADRNTQLKALRTDSTLSKQDRRAKAKGIMDDSDSKVQAVLTDQQKQQWAQIQTNMKAHRQAHRPNQAAPASTAPSGL